MYHTFKYWSSVTYGFVFRFHVWLISGHLNSAARFLQDSRWNVSYTAVIIEQRCVHAARILKQKPPLLIGEKLKRYLTFSYVDWRKIVKNTAVRK